jgi:hypothetical protein
VNRRETRTGSDGSDEHLVGPIANVVGRNESFQDEGIKRSGSVRTGSRAETHTRANFKVHFRNSRRAEHGVRLRESVGSSARNGRHGLAPFEKCLRRRESSGYWPVLLIV